jgi:glutamate racemase
MATEFFPVTVVNNLVVSVPICPNLVSLIRVAWMEVHNEKQVTFLKDDYFVQFMCKRDELVCGCHRLKLLFDCIHEFVKSEKLAVPE